jgi:Glycosyl transferase family 2
MRQISAARTTRAIIVAVLAPASATTAGYGSGGDGRRRFERTPRGPTSSPSTGACRTAWPKPTPASAPQGRADGASQTQRGHGSALALVVVTRDRPDLFARCLMPGLRQTRHEDVDVVVVDQGAGTATRRLLEELPWVRHLRSGPGLSLGRNLGVAATSAQIVVFTDDDVEFGTDWLPRIRALFADHAVGVVCGRGVGSQGRPLPHRHAGIYRWPTSPFGLGHGFNMAFRRDALDDAGPFDEALGAGSSVPSAEDTDMIYRVMRRGWAVLCDDRLVVVHHSWRGADAERATHQAYGMGCAVQTMKHTRTGDTAAIRIAATELVRHIAWSAVSLARRNRRVLGHQRAWAGGFVAGIARGVRSRDGLEDANH